MNGHLKNCTVNEFHLLSFAMSAHSKPMIFMTIFLIYSITVLGNVLIITLICLVSHLQTPMYFFLCNLSVQDIIYISDTLPKFLAITKSGDDRITFPACITQVFVMVYCIGTEFFLLTSMAYDRYIAICIPLHYAIIMRKLICILLASVSWFVGLVNALIQSLILSDADSGGRIKAFSSCSSHLTIVILFYGGVLGTYTILESEHSQQQEKLISLLYTALVPLLNPLVYTLRNKEVLKAMKHVKEKYLTL
uniref:G-protein coupled receptors family 1 profile domain-containing protein n=1 Tax=Pyxicephalus adspersus TaxID=30357 RepID=A0AAV2ZUV3_PYXAD|nr:TPA: hypothetical protein GDO54_016653 [Pyxicephalus adspersus]